MRRMEGLRLLRMPSSSSEYQNRRSLADIISDISVFKTTDIEFQHIGVDGEAVQLVIITGNSYVSRNDFAARVSTAAEAQGYNVEIGNNNNNNVTMLAISILES